MDVVTVDYLPIRCTNCGMEITVSVGLKRCQRVVACVYSQYRFSARKSSIRNARPLCVTCYKSSLGICYHCELEDKEK